MNTGIHRREFLSLTALGGLAAMLSSGITSCTPKGQSAPVSAGTEKIALQLYTVRDHIKNDMDKTLHLVRDAGIQNVETAFWPEDISIQQAAAKLREIGLSVCSAHCELPIGDNKAKMLSIAEAFRCTDVIWHGWPEDERYLSRDGIKALADVYNESNQFAKSNGLRFGLHNHWWEFKNRVDDKYAYQILLEYLDPEIFFELDTYWLKVAGHNPAEVVTAFGKRAAFLHIKDGPARWTDDIATSPEPMVAVGLGSQNFPEILKSARVGEPWLVIEMDHCVTDVFKAVEESHRYLKQQLNSHS